MRFKMTRVNDVPVEELSNQNLLSEYKELPRCIKQNINTKDAPEKYCLGKGHMKWAKHHTVYLVKRFYQIVNEMKYRGFKSNYSPEDLAIYALKNTNICDLNDYIPDQNDIQLNRQRLIERYRGNPKAHKWTNREKPEWLI